MGLNMTRTTKTIARLAALAALAVLASAPALCGDPLPSWNEGHAKKAIVKFVEETTRKDGPAYVPPEERIATFDNDGTLWGEKPMPVQLAFAIARVKEMLPQHPEWKSEEPFAALLKENFGSMLADDRAVARIIMASHSGMTTEEFQRAVTDWIAKARHPKTGRLYTEMVYQPMLELLDYLRAKGFKTYIVSGGGIEFMRPWAEKAYGIPPEQVIGSRAKTKYEMKDGRPILLRLPEMEFLDDKAGKPVGINAGIGRRPVAAFGNSDGDFEMLQWTTAAGGARLGLLVHHTDAEREFAYDKGAEKALAEADRCGWVVVDMKRDWAVVYPAQKP